MRQARILGIAGLALAALAAAAIAQTQTAPLPEPTPAEAVPLPAAAPVNASAMEELAKTNWGDAKAGATKAGACAACHGLDGNPTDLALYPRLAGMPERYVARQLALFKAGMRTSGQAAVMVPFASVLSAQDMRDVGAYFATKRAGAGVADDSVVADKASPFAGEKFYEAGERLYRMGDAARGIPACMACHGPSGSGNPGPAYPHVGGQQSAYLARRLQEYRTGTTTEADPALFNLMAHVAKPLTDAEIQSLASYLQGLHDRADEAPGSVAALPAAAVPAPAPAAPAAPATEPPATEPKAEGMLKPFGT